MYPNPSVTGQFASPALTGALPTVPIRYPPNMIKTINNNHPITTMASPFFVDNLLQHQKAAVNFQSQFVNSQLQSYIQEQHHQFMMQQSQLRHQQALKYAAANLQDGYINNNDQHRKNSLERLTNFSPQHNISRGGSPNSEEASPRMDYEEDDENLNHPRKNGEKDGSADVIREPNEPKEYNSPRNMNGRTSDIRNGEFEDMENKEENSRSADEEIYTEGSPSRSPINNDISSTVKSELRSMSPNNNYDQARFYGSGYQDRLEKYDDKKEPQDDSRGNKDDFQEEPDVNTNNDSDTESNRKILRNPCSNCASYECNPFYPSCKNYGPNNLAIKRYDLLERRISNDSLETGYRSPGRNDINGEERLKESHLDMIKRTSLDSGNGVVQKPVLKFSVSAILGDQNNDGDRPAAASGVKIGHPQDGFTVHSSGVFSIPGFPLAPIAKPIASRPPTFPPHLHSLLAHCRQHPYLTVGGNPSGPVFMTGGGAGAPFPWAGGARGKPRRGMMRRAVFSDTQRRGLERRFQLQKYISKPDRKKLAEKLGLKDSQVKIWFQNRRMKWRNSKERELLASGGSREQTLPNKNNPHPDLSDAEADRPKLSPLSPPSPEQDAIIESDKIQKQKFHNNSNFDSSFENNKGSMNDSSYGHYNPDGCMGAAPNINGVRSYSLMAADDAMVEDYDSDNASGSDEEINVT